jgi:hypothetical protein
MATTARELGMSTKWAVGLFLGLSALGGSTGCASLVPLTHEMRVEHDLGAEELRGLQYYTSHDIVLRRELTRDGRAISGHRLLLTSGKSVEEVVIPAGTPGVAVDIGADHLGISFEPGSSIDFAIGDARPRELSEPVAFQAHQPNPFPGEDDERDREPFDFGSSSFGGSYFVSVSSNNLVRFNGQLYEAVEETLRAHLLIDADTFDEVVEEKTVLGGRKL